MTRALFFAAALSACHVAVPTATDEAAALREPWLNAFNGKQLEPVLALYANDAVFLPITGDRVTGTEALRALYTRVFSIATPLLALHRTRLERSGDLAYDSGDYDETLDTQGKHIAVKGSYLFVYRHTEQGWRIAAQSWTEVPVAPGAHPVE